MIGMWILFYVTDSIPELKDEPYRISMHILAEIVTGSMLIVSGLGLINKSQWNNYILPFSMGMLIYTLIQSPGYYIQKGEISFVAMFAIIFILTIILLVAYCKNEIRTVNSPIK
jgi:hypothetical protein